MDYTLSDSYATHAPTGQRMHKEDQPIPTAVSAKDLNSVIWSLMEVVKEAGLPGVQFDPAVPTSYRVLLNAIMAVQAAASSDIPGRVSIFLQATAPTGWIKANGALLSRTVYAGLWAHVQTVGAISDAAWLAGQSGWFSAGDGSTTFRIPDLRSVFLRGLDDGRGLDPGRLIGAFQNAANLAHTHGLSIAAALDHVHAAVADHVHGITVDAIGNHVHSYTASLTATPGGAEGGARDAAGNTAQDTSAAGGHSHTASAAGAGGHTHAAAGAHTHTGTADSSGGSDLRPINIALPFYIKY